MKNKRVKPRHLPPTDDSPLLHLQRCVLKKTDSEKCLGSGISRLSVTEYGCQKDSAIGLISPLMMNQPAIAPELLSDMACSCRNLCEADCVCDLYSSHARC